MFPSIRSPIASAKLVRTVAIAALMGTTFLASPITAVHADPAVKPPAQLGQNMAATPAATGATQTKGETVEQRITDLHAALKITADEEKSWNSVAQAMRENAAAMDKLVAANQTTPPQNTSAVEDLKTYERFAQAHVDGLKNLISAFTTLYDTMPDAQKKIADKVFDTSESGANTTARGKQG